MSTKRYSARVYLNDGSERVDPSEPLVWNNTNLLLEKGYRGVKTGITKTAGGCLASYWEGSIIVVLGCSSQTSRFQDTETLREFFLDY